MPQILLFAEVIHSSMTSDQVWLTGFEPMFLSITLGFRKAGMFNSLVFPRKALIPSIVKYFALSE